MCLVRWRGRRVLLPPGIEPVPGPSLLLATCYSSSPVGPFLELVVAQPARLGLRVGWCQSCSVVDSASARMGGRLNWGFPHVLGSLVWSADGDARSLRWSERGIEVRGTRTGPPVPWLLPMRALQQRRGGGVIVPSRLRGHGHMAAVDVSVDDAEPGSDHEFDGLAGLAGRHHGLVVGSLRYRLARARTPGGATASFVAPLRVPEGAIGA